MAANPSAAAAAAIDRLIGLGIDAGCEYEDRRPIRVLLITDQGLFIADDGAGHEWCGFVYFNFMAGPPPAAPGRLRLSTTSSSRISSAWATSLCRRDSASITNRSNPKCKSAHSASHFCRPKSTSVRASRSAWRVAQRIREQPDALAPRSRAATELLEAARSAAPPAYAKKEGQ